MNVNEAIALFPGVFKLRRRSSLLTISPILSYMDDAQPQLAIVDASGATIARCTVLELAREIVYERGYEPRCEDCGDKLSPEDIIPDGWGLCAPCRLDASDRLPF
jgi:hypothetical protein